MAAASERERGSPGSDASAVINVSRIEYDEEKQHA
jgi:hypothetical protein